MQTPPSARIQWIQSPINLPGNCSICGLSTCDEGFADPQLYVEWHGSFYFCRNCVGEMANIFDYISPELAKKYEADQQEAQTLLAELRASVSRLEKQVDSLSYERLVSRGHLNLPVNAGIIEPGEGTTDQESDSLIESTDQLLASLDTDEGQEDSDVGELATEQGSDDVNELADSDGELASLGL